MTGLKKGKYWSAAYDEVRVGSAANLPFYRPQKEMYKLRPLVLATLSLNALTLTLHGLGKYQSILVDGAAKKVSRVWDRQTCPCAGSRKKVSCGVIVGDQESERQWRPWGLTVQEISNSIKEWKGCCSEGNDCLC